MSLGLSYDFYYVLEIPEPLAKIGRKNLDFGPGFYLTQIESQAKDWATIIASRKGRETKAVLNTTL